MKYHLGFELVFISLIVTTCSGFVFDVALKFLEQSIRAKIEAKRTNVEIDLEFSFPKTKWCGPGNTALNFNDLGEDKVTDICCRAHDHCHLWIAPGTEMCGTKNTGIFAISSCECDQQFQQCLKSAINSMQSLTGPVVARIYSSLITKCIKTDPKTKNCSVVDSPFKWQ